MSDFLLPENIVFNRKDMIVAFLENEYAGSAMYQITYGDIAISSDDSFDKSSSKKRKLPDKIIGWRFLFEPTVAILKHGVKDTTSGFHINILVAKKGSFDKFRQDRVFRSSKDDGITKLLISLLEKNVKTSRDKDNKHLSEVLQSNPENYEFIIVLGRHEPENVTPHLSTLGNVETEEEYSSYIERMIQLQEERNLRQRTVGGRKKAHKKSKRKSISNKRKSKKRIH
jgi:hypothetical protein